MNVVLTEGASFSVYGAIVGLSPMKFIRNTVPGMKACLAPPIDRDALADITVRAALGEIDVQNNERVMNVKELVEVIGK